MVRVLGEGCPLCPVPGPTAFYITEWATGSSDGLLEAAEGGKGSLYRR